MLHLEVPEGKQKVLLHCCCAPCSGAVVECLIQNGIRPVLFFSNSNIDPQEEYILRRSELERYAKQFDLQVVDDDYDHDAWLDFVLKDEAMAAEPERGARCLECFKFRLMRAAKYAAENGYEVLTTTLASSRWKSLEQVEEAGRWACKDSIVFWPQNWRKGGLQPRRAEIICEQKFYNQTFCGCEFSEHHDK